MQELSKPGYYAVIPADVRYNDQIPANAKLLYGEISALIGADGYCYASNAYFGNIYGLSERTVRSLIGKLQEAGFLQVEMEKDSQTGQVTRRKIWLKLSSTDERPVEEIFPTPGKNLPQGGEENFQPTLYTNLSITNKERNKKERKKEDAKNNSGSSQTEDFDPLPLYIRWIGETFGNIAGKDDMNALYLAFVRFNENRKAMKKPMKTQGAVTGLCNKLRKIAKDDLQMMIELLDEATLNGWQSIYARTEAKPPAKTSSGGRVYECL